MTIARPLVISVALWVVLFAITTEGFVGSTFAVPRLTTSPAPSSSWMIYSRFVASASSKSLSMSAATQSVTIPSWSDLKNRAGSMPVGIALNKEAELREMGKGSAFVQNKLRKFGSVDEPKITLFRDHAGWCPYCEKTMLLIEEKQVPVKIDLVPMRSYGDKPQEFLRKVPNGLLPAIEVNGQVVTESQVIMELLDQWHSKQDGYRPMLPREGDTAGWERYKKLARLERDLFGWWCTLLFRPEGGNPLTMLMASSRDSMSGAMQGFLDCMQKVDQELLSSNGPWFFDEHDYPTMIDFVYVSHVERMLASCAHWKGLDLRNPKWNLKGLNAWLEAFEKREPYLAFKSDYYTNVMDIPPQYGPGYDGGFNDDRKKFQASILGRDGKSWKLPLSFDDELQPLYRGMPLPSCVLDAAGLQPDSDGTYGSCDETTMSQACRAMAAWKLAGNGNNVSRFAARGGPQGAKNPRKRFGAELADPYAETDNEIRSATDSALRVVCAALMDVEATLPDQAMVDQLRSSVPDNQVEGVAAALAYLRDRVGVPRDLPLAAGRYFRAYLNWGIETLSK